MEDICLVYVPVPGKEEAERIAETIVAMRLAACVNISSGITSIYRWEGKMQKDSECVMIFKTKASLADELEDEIKKLHSYACPCVLSIPVHRVNEEYKKWVNEETK
ncbi:MAG: divalent-cation tolerance protein CutA [Candidatus Omnitrophota bacterium]